MARRLELLRRERSARNFEERPREANPASYPPGTVVMGPDGTLYRVNIPDRRKKRGSVVVTQLSDRNDNNFSGLEGNKENRNEEEHPLTDLDVDDASDVSSLGWEDWAQCPDCPDDKKESKTTRLSDTVAHCNAPPKEIVMEDGSEEWAAWPSAKDESKATRLGDTIAHCTASSQKIVVEDVPDDEDDELRDLRSVWRNRVPSPGKWMEPVELSRQ